MMRRALQLGPGALAPVLVLLLVAWSAQGAEVQPAAETPLAPVDTSSPRATFESFRSNVQRAYQSWRLRANAAQTEDLGRRVLRTLDLSHVGEALRNEVGIDNALYLYDTISRLGAPPPASIPDAAEMADTLPFPSRESPGYRPPAAPAADTADRQKPASRRRPFWARMLGARAKPQRAST